VTVEESSDTAGRPDDLCFASARRLCSLVRSRELSARELMLAHLEQIRRLNPVLNAIVAKLDDEECLVLAETADRRLARGETLGPLHGLPIAFKDLEAAAGFPCTSGSPIFKDYLPAEDTVLVERLRKAGVIPIGKTNVPEFGLGSHTYNRVYGTTVNPYDVTKSAGGSSGGAAAALAAGLLPIADGSDLGGSLRNPASFNNIVGLRPTVGLVPMAPTGLPFVGFAVKGPLARSVDDVAFLLSLIAGPDPRDPGCYPCEPLAFADSLERGFKGVRVAWCPDLGGLPLDRRVRLVLDAQRRVFEDLGCIVDDACPDLNGADEIFHVIRSWLFWNSLGPLLREHRESMKPEAVWQIEAGARLSGADIARAMVRQADLMERMRVFQAEYEFILCAVSQVPPFEAMIDWPKEIEGVEMDNYLAWMKSAYWISATFLPSLSVPAGFTPEGLPVGIQIVGRYRDDLGVLQMGRAFEQATGFGQVRPSIASS
jgi:amidase